MKDYYQAVTKLEFRSSNASKLCLSGVLSNLSQLRFSYLYSIIKYNPFLAFLKYCCKDQVSFY